LSWAKLIDRLVKKTILMALMRSRGCACGRLVGLRIGGPFRRRGNKRAPNG
jgi:hypothetical protein